VVHEPEKVKSLWYIGKVPSDRRWSYHECKEFFSSCAAVWFDRNGKTSISGRAPYGKNRIHFDDDNNNNVWWTVPVNVWTPLMRIVRRRWDENGFRAAHDGRQRLQKETAERTSSAVGSHLDDSYGKTTGTVERKDVPFSTAAQDERIPSSAVHPWHIVRQPISLALSVCYLYLYFFFHIYAGNSVR